MTADLVENLATKSSLTSDELIQKGIKAFFLINFIFLKLSVEKFSHLME